MLESAVNFQILQETARQRWLKSSEVFAVLKWAQEKRDLPNIILQVLPDRPPAGTIYLLDTSKAGKKWKQDGHEYVKRKNGTGFKEESETLKVGGVKEITCYYSQIETGGLFSKNDQFYQYPTHRRIYKLLKKDGEGDSSIFLVHYFSEFKQDSKSTDNESILSRTPMPLMGMSTGESSIKNEKQMSVEDNDIFNSNSSIRQSPESAFLFHEENFEFQNQSPLFEDNTSGQLMIPEKSEFNLHFETANQEIANNFFQPILPQADRPQHFAEYELSNTYQDPNYQRSNPEDTSETLSFENFFLMKNKIKELEERIHDLEKEKVQNESILPQQKENILLADSLQNSQQPPQGQSNPKTEDYGSLKLSIVDFSPEWDWTKGGAKVIICVNPSFEATDAFNEQLTVDFGGMEVPACQIQPGVIKCYAPAHPQGLVKLAIYWNKQKISKPNLVNLFEYRKKQGDKKKKIAVGNSNNIESANESIRNEFKIRIIEKIQALAFPEGTNYLADTAPREESQRDSNENSVSDSSESSDCENYNILGKSHRKTVPPYVAHIAGSNFEDFNDDKCHERLKNAIDTYSATRSKSQLIELLNKCDDQGLSIVHYLVYIGFRKSCELVLDVGANTCLVANGNITPLEIALSLGDEKMIELLVKKGALVDQNSKALLEEINNKAIHSINIESILSNSKIIDMLVREASLCDSLHNSAGGDSLSLRVNFDEGDNVDAESYVSLSDLIENLKLLGVKEAGQNQPPKQDETETERRKRIQRKRGRYLRNYDKKQAVNENNIMKEDDPANQVAKAHAEHQDHIQKIQKNVRGWLLRRQYLDILHATRVLQSYIKKKYSKKPIPENYDQNLKNMVKDWLKLQN